MSVLPAHVGLYGLGCANFLRAFFFILNTLILFIVFYCSLLRVFIVHLFCEVSLMGP